MAISIGIVGLGKMGLSHLAIANALEHFNVVGMCDKSVIVGNVLSKYTKIPFYSEFDELLKIPGLQAILIATPTTTHEPLARKALELGIHVFCEKPLTLKSQDSAALAALAAERGLVAQVGYHNRFIGTFGEVRRLLKTGAIGRISHIKAEAYGPVVLKEAKPTWRGKAGNGGGCLYDYAAHPLNLVNWYLGETIAATGAILKSGFSAEVDDEVYASLGFAEGVTGQIAVNWSDPSVRKMTTRITVWGTAGRIYADRQEIQVYLGDGATVPEGYSSGWTVKYITELTPPISYYLRGEEYSAQLEAFGNAIASGASDYENSFRSSAETDRTIEMIRESATSGGATGRFAASAVVPRKSGLVGRLMGR